MRRMNIPMRQPVWTPFFSPWGKNGNFRFFFCFRSFFPIVHKINWFFILERKRHFCSCILQENKWKKKQTNMDCHQNQSKEKFMLRRKPCIISIRFFFSSCQFCFPFDFLFWFLNSIIELAFMKIDRRDEASLLKWKNKTCCKSYICNGGCNTHALS